MKFRKFSLCTIVGILAFVPLAVGAGNAAAAPAPEKWTAVAVVIQQQEVGVAYVAQDKATEQEAKDAVLAACKNRPKTFMGLPIDTGSGVVDMCRVQFAIKSGDCGAVAYSKSADISTDGKKPGSVHIEYVKVTKPAKAGGAPSAASDAFTQALTFQHPAILGKRPVVNDARVLWQGCQA